MTAWEYHLEVVPAEACLSVCQQVGKDGWELVHALPVLVAPEAVPHLNGNGRLQLMQAAGQPRQGLQLVFKRPAPVEVPAAVSPPSLFA